jgi:hypothetical protein
VSWAGVVLSIGRGMPKSGTTIGPGDHASHARRAARRKRPHRIKIAPAIGAATTGRVTVCTRESKVERPLEGPTTWLTSAPNAASTTSVARNAAAALPSATGSDGYLLVRGNEFRSGSRAGSLRTRHHVRLTRFRPESARTSDPTSEALRSRGDLTAQPPISCRRPLDGILHFLALRRPVRDTFRLPAEFRELSKCHHLELRF